MNYICYNTEIPVKILLCQLFFFKFKTFSCLFDHDTALNVSLLLLNVLEARGYQVFHYKTHSYCINK